MESFKELQSLQNAKNGESGLLIEKVNGKNIVHLLYSNKICSNELDCIINVIK